MSLTVTIIDDEKEARDLLYSLLKEIPLVTEVLADYSTAFSAYPEIIKNPPDILLLDIKIGKDNGIDFANQLKKHRLHTNIIFVTAYSEFSIQAIRANAFDYLLKPVNVEELTEAIVRCNAKLKEGEIDFKYLNQSYSVSNREANVIKLLIEGKTHYEIADVLNISDLTVKTHKQNIYRKLGVNNICDLMNLIFRKIR